MSERFKVHRDDGRERYVLVDTRDGREVGEDGGEPEDQLLIRDWSWVAVEMNRLDDELERLRMALRPFAALWPGVESRRRTDGLVSPNVGIEVEVIDLKRAAEVLK